MQRGQISFDFLIITIFAFILLLELFQVYLADASSARIIEDKASALRIGNILARAINEISKVNGSNTVVSLPESLDDGETYHVSIKATGRRVEVFWPLSEQNRSIGIPILTSNITELNISKSANSGPTALYIVNLDGMINISIT